MFLYFLQRKGWLGGRPHFLTELFRRTFQQHVGEAHGGGETHYFYREVLEPLFFDTLNQRRPDHITRWESIRIPYLNGGLFDRARDPAGVLLLPDSLFDPFAPGGLLEFFNRFNFTVADDTPLEQDVAVDPEMLGKVFENMLEERDRGQSGSFYTPRPIVAYMCQEALAGYLDERGALPRETARALFDPDAETALTPEQAAAADAALSAVTVLDPAVGSGSFLIGMLNEILWLKRRTAAAHGVAVTPETVAGWKEAIIRDSLYGVDIKPEAIEIAQLRLWLALVVDQTLDQAKPLPNLDYKLMAGNSLIETLDGEPVLLGEAAAMVDGEFEPQQASLGLFGADQHRLKLAELRREFFAAEPDERKRLRADLQAMERRIVQTALQEKTDHVQTAITQLGKKAGANAGVLGKADQKKLADLTARQTRLLDLMDAVNRPNAPLPFFLYRLHFSEVFARGGFDIVVANPPYVRGELLGDLKDELKVTPVYQDVYAGTADLYVYFYARALDLLRPNGQLSFITSNKYLRANYGKGLRGFLAAQLDTRELIDFGELRVFKEAATFPLIVLGEKTAPRKQTRFTQVTAWEDQIDVWDIVEQGGLILPEHAVIGDHWQLAEASIIRLTERMKIVGRPLFDYVRGRMFYGIKTGLNVAFVIDSTQKAELIAADPRSAELIRPFVVGDDIRKWRIRERDAFLIFTRRGTDIDLYPAIRTHLEQWREDLTPKVSGNEEKGRKPGRYKWFEIQDDIAYFPSFEVPKIIYPDIAMESRFAFDTAGTFFGNTAYMLVVDDKYLLGVLNSSLVWFYVKQQFACLGDPNNGGRFRFFSQSVETIPIPNPPAPLRAQIAAVAQQCLDAAASHPGKLPALEAHLNALVYEAYGLDEEDVKVIEGSVGGRKDGGDA
jgi:hypothetical protein